MVGDVPFVLAGDLNDRVMPRPGGDAGILLAYFADALKRAKWRVGHGVGNAVFGARPAAFRPHKIVFSIADEHKGALHVTVGRDFLENFAVFKRQEAREISVQPGDVAMPPAAIDEVKLPVLVLEYKLVNGLSAVVKLIHERLAEVIPVGAAGLVRHRHADSTVFGIALNVVCSEEKIVFAILFHRRGCPHGHVRPLHSSRIEDARVFCPVDQVGGREGIEIHLFRVLVAVGWKNLVAIAKNPGFRVGVPAFEKRVARGRFWQSIFGGRAAHKQGHEKDNVFNF